MKTTSTDIVIVGAGAPGALLALKCADMGLSVTIIEREIAQKFAPKMINEFAQDPQNNGRSVALMTRACDELQNWGILEDLKPCASSLKALQIIDDSYFPADDNAKTEMICEIFYADEIGYEEFGYNIPLTPLIARTQQELQNHKNINFVDGAEIFDISFDSHSVTVSLKGNDSSLKAPLIIGADGRGSIVRDMAGIKMKRRCYDQVALTCVIAHEKSHDHISTEFHRPTGPFTLVPMQGQYSSIVWCEMAEKAKDYLNAEPSTIKDAIQKRSRDLLGEIKSISTLNSWELASMMGENLIAHRTALIAEAAHVLSPIGAQGMNMSIRDVDDLFTAIKQAALNGLDIGSTSTLRSYASKRRVDMTSRGLGVDLFHRAVATNKPAIHKIRRLGLKTLPAVTLLREVLMQEGLAPKKR